MKKRAMVDDYRRLAFYRKLGYIPADREPESVSKTLEYVYDDWAVAHVASAVGATDDAKLLLEHSRNYRNVFDAKLCFIRPRLENGEWAEPFDPKGMGHSKQWRDFTNVTPGRVRLASNMILPDTSSCSVAEKHLSRSWMSYSTRAQSFPRMLLLT